MRILAIDPGPRQSAWLILDVETAMPVEFDIWLNTTLGRVRHLAEHHARVRAA